MKLFAKSRTISLLIGLVVLTMTLPGGVSAHSISSSTSQSVKDNLYYFGGNGNTTIYGDWNGDGKLNIGAFNNGVWYLDYNGDGVYTSGVDKTYNFGSTGFTPIIGDWNGDGRDKIGVFKNGAWYLDYLGEGTWTANTKAYGFGAAGFTPIIGDWNGNGRDKIGVFKNGAWYLDYLGEGTWTSHTKSYSFGSTGFTPIIGDWNGNGKIKIGVTNGLTWYIDLNGDGTYNQAAEKKSFGVRGWTPVVGDWNGDGITELAVTNGYTWQVDANGDGVFTAPSTVVVTKISPTAQFSANVVAGQTPLTVQFTDKSVSTGTTTYAWDINNDGTVDYTTKNPSHTYQAAGTYAVKLTVTNASGSDSEIKTNYIKVSSAGVLSVLSVPSSTLYLTDYGIKADGSDETTLLQSAFNYAAANGKTKIVFPSGGKTIGLNDYVETPNNVELIGNGCTIKLIDEADINQENSFFYVNDGCYVHDLRFNGNSHNQKGSDYVDAIDGIHLYDNVRFEDNEVYNIGAYAINGYHAYNVIINHNNIHDIWQYGISMYGPDNDHSTNIIITNNTFTNCGEQAIKLRQTSNVLIQDNTMSIGTSPRGYDTPMGIGFSDDGSNSYVTINRNIMDAYGVGGTGIWSGIQSNANVVITNNRITNADYAGMIITFDYATITGNTITYRNICIKTDGTGITKSGNTCSPL